MARKLRLIYGWFDPKENLYRISLFPADCPVRPSLSFPSAIEAREYAQRKRYNIQWWPPLSQRSTDRTMPETSSPY